jgi:hypothetical protein
MEHEASHHWYMKEKSIFVGDSTSYTYIHAFLSFVHSFLMSREKGDERLSIPAQLLPILVLQHPNLHSAWVHEQLEGPEVLDLMAMVLL